MARIGGRRQKLSKSCEEDEAVLLPELPNEIIRQILPLIPTKSAFRISLLSKQFEGAWCSGPEIDLDEGNPDGGGINFTNVLKRYLKFRNETSKEELHPDHQSLLKFRLRMAMDDPVRQDILEELFPGFAKERRIKELDLSFLTKPPRLLSLQTLLHINCLTSLTLESVPLKGDVARSSDMLLPFLKTMSLKSMQLPYSNFSDMLIERCPSIEKLSVTSCSFDLESQQYSLCIPHSATLNSIKLRNCSFRYIYVTGGGNLESFTLVSESPDVKRLKFFECDSLKNSLKNIEIFEKHLESISLILSSADCVDITVDTPNITSFTLNSEDMRHNFIDGKGSFTYFSRYYLAVQELKKMGIDPDSLFGVPGQRWCTMGHVPHYI